MEKAVIGSSVGGIGELMRDGVTGLRHRSGDIDDLAAKIERLAGDPQLRRTLGRQAREWVSQERDWKHIVPRYVKIYESALARRSPAAEPARLG